MRRLIQAWLKAGVMEGVEFSPTDQGTPQGGVASPLLANIALHGMEEAIRAAYTTSEGKPHVIRYADDFLIFHATEQGVKKAHQLVVEWLAGMGLELKASKTSFTHTLNEYQGKSGFDFLGFVRHESCTRGCCD